MGMEPPAMAGQPPGLDGGRKAVGRAGSRQIERQQVAGVGLADQEVTPIRRNLERLAQFGDFDQAKDHAQTTPLPTIVPWVEDRPEGDGPPGQS